MAASFIRSVVPFRFVVLSRHRTHGQGSPDKAAREPASPARPLRTHAVERCDRAFERRHVPPSFIGAYVLIEDILNQCSFAGRRRAVLANAAHVAAVHLVAVALAQFHAVRA